MLLFPQRSWKIQPPFGAAEIDWGHRLTRGLLAFWPCWEQVGQAVDLVRGFAATPTNGAGWVTSLRGNVLALDGTNDYFTAGNLSGLNFERTDAFSVSAWIRLNTTAPVASSLVGKSTVNTGWQLTAFCRATLNSTAISLFLLSSGVNLIEVNSGAATIAATTLYHVVSTYDGSSAASGVGFYINAVAQTPTVVSDVLSATIQTTQGVLFGGRDASSLTQLLNGQMDTIAVYSGVLSAQDVLELYREPYAMLRPIVRRRYFAPPAVVVPPTGTVPLGGLHERLLGRGLGRGVFR